MAIIRAICLAVSKQDSLAALQMVKLFNTKKMVCYDESKLVILKFIP